MMNPAPIAFIADIHGNTWALDAVLQDIARRQIAQIVQLGDCAYGSLDPAGTLDRLIARGIPGVMGNQDRVVFDQSEAARRSADQQFALRYLNDQHVEWLQQLPPSLVIGDIFCCHGTPDSDEAYLLEEVTPPGVFLRARPAIEADLRGVSQSLVLCGHSHVARTMQLSNGQLVVNPGSVGQPAYDHDVPYPHSMEAGSPHARYAIVTQQPGGWLVEHIAVPYDWHAAAAVAAHNGRPDRAYWILHGRTEER